MVMAQARLAAAILQTIEERILMGIRQ